jgi:hypothetical protein
VATKYDLLTGREVADIGQRCPTSFTTGNLVNFLKKEAKAIGATHYLEKYAGDIIEKKKAAMGPGCPLLPRAVEVQPA